MSHFIMQIQGLNKAYKEKTILEDLTLSYYYGAKIGVLGGNGAGKSTILRAIMGSRQAYQGEILFEGRDIRTLPTEEIVRLGITYVPEEKMLFSPLTVEENILMGATS